MAKPNYAFEKRQKELAKKQKKQEKLAQRKAADSPDSLDNPDSLDSPDNPDFDADTVREVASEVAESTESVPPTPLA